MIVITKSNQSLVSSLHLILCALLTVTCFIAVFILGRVLITTGIIRAYSNIVNGNAPLSFFQQNCRFLESQ